MTTPADDSLDAEGLRRVAFLFAAASVLSWWQFAENVELGLNQEGAVWLAGGVVGAVLAGTCAVLVGVKNVERRLAQRLTGD